MPTERAASAPSKRTVGSPSKAVSDSMLRRVFDSFDADGSGAVSVEEMAAMVKRLNLKLTPAQVKKLVADADPNGSGEIDFKEFTVVLRKQLKEGGGLGDVVTSALDAFGWLNPMSWFGGEEEGQPKPTGGAMATSTSAKARVLLPRRCRARPASPAKVVKKKQTSPTALTSSKGPSAAAQLSKRAASAGASKPAAAAGRGAYNADEYRAAHRLVHSLTRPSDEEDSGRCGGGELEPGGDDAGGGGGGKELV